MAEENFFSGQPEISKAILYTKGGPLDLLSKDQGNIPFFKILMRESMFAPMVTGTLFIQDKNQYGEKLKFFGGEVFEMTVESVETDSDQGEDTTVTAPDIFDSDRLKKINFVVNRVRSVTDEGTLQIDSEVGPATMWTLDLVPYEMMVLNKEVAPFYEKEFMGKIASDGDDGLINYLSKYFKPIPPASAQKPMDIEPTINNVWLKGSQASYPLGKKNSHLELGRLINYLAENAVSEDNVNAVNYLFWQDLSQWHFRSIDSLIKLQETPVKTFKVSFEKTSKNVFTGFAVTKQADQTELINSDAHRAFYDLIEPNYDDPYLHYMPTNEKLKKQRIKYDYLEDYDKWNHIEKHCPIVQSMNYDEQNSNEITDNCFGWYSLGEYNDSEATKMDFYKNENQKSDINEVWQTMFDITDLDIETIKKIRQEILKPAKTKYDIYSRKRLLKEKWNVYKYSICCLDQPTPEAIMKLGYITGFERYALPTDEPGVPRHIWKYTWVPLELWLKDEVENLDEILQGATYEVVAQDGPFAVVLLPPPEGVTLEAYNINEINNDYYGRVASEMPDYDSVINGQEGQNAGNTASYLGPGINEWILNNNSSYYTKRENWTQFANISSQHYLPVGGALILHDDMAFINDGLHYNSGVEDSIDTWSTYIKECYLEPRGHVVEILEVPDNLQVLRKTDDPVPSEVIYLFNVENAVDGSCPPCVLGDLVITPS